MIRARSPLFLLSFTCAVLLGVGAAWILFTGVDPALAMESWVKGPRLGAFRGIGWGLSLVGAVGLLVVGIIEYRIKAGWEPRWLRRFVPGCLVVDVYKHGSDPKEHRRIEVQSPQGWANWYILDSDEVGLCNVGDTIHLWAIGKHVAHIAVIDPSIIVYPPKARIANWGRAIEQSQGGCAWMLMTLAPLIGGGIVGKGLEHLFFGEVYYSGGGRRSRPPRIETGLEAQIIGILFLIAGVSLIGYVLHRWLTGWDDEEIDVVIEGVLTPRHSRRGWWM